MGLAQRHDRSFAEALEDITDGFIEDGTLGAIHLPGGLFFFYCGFSSRGHVLLSKYKCKGQICVFGKYSTDVLSVKVKKSVRCQVCYFLGVAVGEGVRKYNLGAGGVATWNPPSPWNL